MSEETGYNDGASAQVESQPLDLRVDQGFEVIEGPPLDTPDQHTVLLDTANRRKELVREADNSCLTLQLVEPTSHGTSVANVPFVGACCHRSVGEFGESMLIAREKIGAPVRARVRHYVGTTSRDKRRLGSYLHTIDDI